MYEVRTIAIQELVPVLQNRGEGHRYQIALCLQAAVPRVTEYERPT